MCLVEIEGEDKKLKSNWKRIFKRKIKRRFKKTDVWKEKVNEEI